MAPKTETPDRREQIIQAAARCFSRKGFYRTSMDDIVTESGLSKGTLYWHFESKDDLLIELTRWYFLGFENFTREVLEKDTCCEEKLAEVFRMFASMIQETRDMMPIMMDFIAHSRSNEKLKETIRQIYEEWFGELAAMLDGCIEKGELRPFDTHNLTAALGAAFDGLILQDIFLWEVDWEGVVDTMLDAVLNGIKAKDAGEEAK